MVEVPVTTTFARRVRDAATAAAPVRCGKVTRMVGLDMEIEGLDLAIGDAVRVITDTDPLLAEVVAVHEGTAVCLPYGELRGVRCGARVDTTKDELLIRVGRPLLGRVLDGLGRPIDGGPSISHLPATDVGGHAPHPLHRQRIDTQLQVGVRAIDTLIPVGKGQRIGIFAGSGVGKSSLLSMIARGTDAEVSVIALVGERGREVREFIENDLGPEGLARSVVVVATSDEPALVRLRAAFTATRIAEWYREQGADVILMMDSLTRFSMAQREIGLAAGEPPASRGYPPSVFGLMPRLLERAGMSDRGSITGIYTILVEGDDMNEPIADTARSILDGHVVLSRKLASAGHFPTIEVLDSASRVAGAVTTREQRQASQAFRRLLASYREAQDLIEIGAYVSGSNPTVDLAVALRDPMLAFLQQDLHDLADAQHSWATLEQLMAEATG